MSDQYGQENFSQFSSTRSSMTGSQPQSRQEQQEAYNVVYVAPQWIPMSGAQMIPGQEYYYYASQPRQEQVPIAMGAQRSPRPLPQTPEINIPTEITLPEADPSFQKVRNSISKPALPPRSSLTQPNAALPSFQVTPLQHQNPHRVSIPTDATFSTNLLNHSTSSVVSGTSTVISNHGGKNPAQNKPAANGPFVYEIPVPSEYMELCAEKTRQEFHHVRYTAVTVDPHEFNRPENGYILRQKLMNRVTELFVVITMYNEDDELFTRTMTAVMKNIAYLCSTSNPRTWGPVGWTHAVVCIVADGRSKIHPRVLSVLGAQGIFPLDFTLPNTVNGKPVKSHVFEFTTQVSVGAEGKLLNGKDGLVPVQVLFCLKEKNAKKINSHRWFLDAFATMLQPNVCILLDVGTKPTKYSFYHLWKEFELDPNCGGACGEIRAQIDFKNIWNPLVAAQNFEYKMSNILDKPLESVFGYIQVLPGAFSAYRFDAIQNYGASTGPLASYFKGETLHSGEADVFAANMYLAEDRILCLEVVTKKNSKWKLKYVKNAKADTDVPSSLPELVSQRRRWLNGSFFAAVHSITHFHLFFRSKHGILRKLLFAFQTLYNAGNLLMTWFAIGNMYLTFYFLFDIVYRPDKDPFKGSGPAVFEALRTIYMALLCCMFIMSFGNRPQGFKSMYYAISFIFSFIMITMLFLGAYTVYYAIPKNPNQWKEIGSLLKQAEFRDIVLSLGSTYGVYILASLMFLDPWHIFTSMLQYLLLLPTYVNVFMIYSFCNLHDISWGTKGDNQVQGATAATISNQQGQKPIQESNTSNAENQEASKKSMENLNQLYRETLHRIQNKPPPEKSARDRQTRNDDYFRMYRTRIVLLWIFTNGLLVILLTNPNVNYWMTGEIMSRRAATGYLAFIFWTVTAFSCVRFLGSLAYLVLGMTTRGIDLATRGKPFVPYRLRDQQRRQSV